MTDLAKFAECVQRGHLMGSRVEGGGDEKRFCQRCRAPWNALYERDGEGRWRPRAKPRLKIKAAVRKEPS